MGSRDLRESRSQGDFMPRLLEDVATRYSVHCLHFQNDEIRGQNK